MMAQLLTPAPGRMSQLLPTVKCSNCNRPVPLAELGDHTCAVAPPVPSLPKPSVSPIAATSLLPTRLQNLVSPPAPSPAGSPQQDRRTPSNDRPRINTAGNSVSSFQTRPSPLSRTDPDGSSVASREGRPRDPYPPGNGSSTLRTRPPPNGDFRTHTTSNTGSLPTINMSPRTARPSFASSQDNSYPNAVQPPPRQTSHTPHPVVREIDTKSGGEAGMAGVGRRGFAAAARAAMFATPPNGDGDRPSDPPLRARDGRRGNPPRFLDLDAPAGSAVVKSLPSLHSPVSPGPPKPPVARSAIPTRPPPNKTTNPDVPTTPASALSARLPFFEKYKNRLPALSGIGANINSDSTSPPNDKASTNDINTPATATPASRIIVRQPPPSEPSSGSSYGRSPPARSTSTNTTSSQSNPKTPLSPSSGSEYGLAYADSTDYEDEDGLKSSEGKIVPPPLPLTSSILRSSSNTNTTHVRFPSLSNRNAGRVDAGKAPVLSLGLKKDKSGSVSSLSSTSSAEGEGRNRSNSAVIAHALGLAQTPPSAYAKLGGPGLGTASRGSGSSSGSGSRYSRSTTGGTGTGTSGMEGGTGVMERAMETLLEDTVVGGGGSMGSEGGGSRLLKSKSTGKQKSFAIVGSRGGIGGSTMTGSLNSGAVGKAYRSKTVQGPHSPENRTAKLPVRARTSAKMDRERSLEREDGRGDNVGRERRVRAKKDRVCVRCEKKIEDGRWVQVDGGGVLCERCWKNMYLPKCRRCTLPIEKQAVSSSDGQLKGKYHRECFNCHTCHKPFPDKTFYVFDGKPLCAYHYHEENDSLCAAALCGQPIEGPCAVSHTGDRYHPQHLLCEFPGSKCGEKLDEYWEVDGRMLCERHANMSKVADDGNEDEEFMQSTRAKKRVTRYIDLAGTGMGGGSGSGLM